MSTDNIIIIINSSNRASKVTTHQQFPADSPKWMIAVPFDQYFDYLKHFEKDRIFRMPDTVKPYLSSQRQYVMELFSNRDGYKYVWLMDDDLTFFKRNDELKLRKCDDPEMKMMFRAMDIHTQEENIPMVGISTRLGNNRVTEDHADITRVTRCYALSTEVFKAVGASFAPFEPFLAQDFHLTLCWLNAGHANRVLYSYAQEDVGSNAEGGVSSYRSPELLRKVSFWMEENHPEVTAKAKKADNWDGFGSHRVDMVVQWKKAYKPKQTRPKGGLAARLAKRKAK